MADSRAIGVLAPMAPAGKVGLAYALLYAAVALSLSRTVELDWLALPALALAAVTALAERTSLSERRIAVLGMAGFTVIAAVAAAVAS